jgi:hypothetical protein
MLDEIESVLNQFDKIDLEGLEKVKLLNRVDSKFIFHVSELSSILNIIKSNYSLLEINELHSFNYETVYFDSPKFQLYHAHHNGKLNRFKIRRRHYLYNNQNFLEIKQKIKGNRTHKFRIEKSGEGNIFSEIEQEILTLSGAPKIELEEKLKVYYTRLTFASKFENERITVDLGLTYSNENVKKEFKELAILEVKQDSMNRNSGVLLCLKTKKIRPLSISKYAIGIAMIESSVKKNAFKSKILQINKLLIDA